MKIVNVDIFKRISNIRLKKLEYIVMSFEYTNISIIFQLMMNKILRLYLDKFVIVYSNVIVIDFNLIDKYRQHVQLIISFFRKHQFFCKFYEMYVNQKNSYFVNT